MTTSVSDELQSIQPLNILNNKPPRGIDANMAGGADRHNCVLYVTDIYSAGVLNKHISYENSNYIGLLVMEGEDWNRIATDRLEIECNDQLRKLKMMLGLLIPPSHGEKYYLDPANFNRLRYGAVMLMTDKDTNGNKLISFVLNYFHYYFPSLLSRGYVMYYHTPLLRVSKYGKLDLFYTKQEYNEWKKINNNTYSTWVHTYYKKPATVIQDPFASDIPTHGIQLQVLFDTYIIPYIEETDSDLE